MLFRKKRLFVKYSSRQACFAIFTARVCWLKCLICSYEYQLFMLLVRQSRNQGFGLLFEIKT